MSPRPCVLHLVDDTTAGGVMRVLDFICSDPGMAETAHHRMQSISRGGKIGKLRDADVIVSHLTVSWRGLPALLALRIQHPRTPLLHVEHSYTEHFVLHNVRLQLRFRTLLRTAYALFDRVICVSNGQARWIKWNRLVSPQALAVIQSCVDLEAFRQVPGRIGPPRIFAAIGRLDRQKGFDTLIRAFRLNTDSDIRLHIIGTGDQEAALRSLAEGDKRIAFKGHQEDTARALADIDVVVMPSRWEAYGLVAIETLVAGRRLLCSNIDGLKDHTSLGSISLPNNSVSALCQQITIEAKGQRQRSHPSFVLQGRHLEQRFCDKWNALLQEVCSGAKCLKPAHRHLHQRQES